MIISIIVAMGKDKTIGSHNALPWKMPADMKHFRELTVGKAVVMGRKTFETLGRPLSNRINIVITGMADYRAPGCIVVHSIEEAVAAAAGQKELMVAGGASIYGQFLARAHVIYMTIIGGEFEGDARFPDFDMSEWRETCREDHAPDENNPFSYVFLTLERKTIAGE
jgi:dihydrofolate reductase